MAKITCVDCGAKGPEAVLMAQAREAAEAGGWLTGKRGSTRVLGWEDDFCPACAPSHPRIYCDGYKKKTCGHRALAVATRKADGVTVRVCGSHMSKTLTELFRGGACEIEEIPA